MNPGQRPEERTITCICYFYFKRNQLQLEEKKETSVHPYMTTGKTIALTRRTFVGKVMSLLFNMLLVGHRNEKANNYIAE